MSMKFWEVVENQYFVNVDNITFIDWNGKNKDGKNEFTVGFTSGKSQGFTTNSTQEEFAEEIAEQLMGQTKKEDENIANSEELPKSEPAWRAVLGE